LTVSIAAQQLPRGVTRECGTVLSPAQIAAERARQASGYTEIVPQVNRPYRVPLAIHIVRLDDGTGGFALDNVAVAIEDLNTIWTQVGVQFYQRGGVDFINSTYHSNVPDSQARRDELRRVNPVTNTINVWFTQLDELCGQSTFTGDLPQGILMNNACAGAGNSPTTFAHEVGHYFDLYHTHETGFGVECPSAENCSDTGDLFCSTPADPELDYENDVTSACVWTGSALNPSKCNNPGTYDPPTRNVMSYSRRTCRTQFTSQQESKAVLTLVGASNRSQLINAFSRFASPDGNAISSCTFQNPCNSLARASSFAAPGDNIFLLSGTYNEITTVTKRLFLKKWNTDAGTIVIGRP
jgi:hypothetical protein